MTLQPDSMTEIINTLTELKQMHRLNMELLEQFSIACDFLLKSGVSVPNASTFASLLNKSMALLNEIQADEPKTLQYNINRRKVTDFGEKDGTVGEVPEPLKDLFKGG